MIYKRECGDAREGATGKFRKVGGEEREMTLARPFCFVPFPLFFLVVFYLWRNCISMFLGRRTI